MIRRIDSAQGVVLVSRHPVSVFTTTTDYIDSVKRKPDGHYDREDLIPLVKQGHAVLYDEKAVRAIAEAIPALIFGGPPV